MVYTNNGITQIITYLRGGSATEPTHIALGTDNTTPDEEDTALYAEKGRYVIGETSYGDDWIKISIVLPSTSLNGNTLKEFGSFNASTSGTMYSRTINASIIKTSSLEVQYEITLKVTNG